MNNMKFTPLPIEGNPPLKVRYYEAAGAPKGIIIFVHGVSHGAWCWENFAKFFTDNGYACFMLNLRDHGDDNKNIPKKACLSDYVDDVARCVAHCKAFCEIPENKLPYSKPFILGHSMGGGLVEIYISEHSDEVKGAILFAPVTAQGMGFISGLASICSKTGRNTTPTVKGQEKPNEHLAESNFFVAKVNDRNFTPRITDPKELEYYDSQLCSESQKAMFGLINFDLSNNIHIPVFVIGSYVDAYFPEKSLTKTAAFYGCKTTDTRRKLLILENLCHDMMLDPDWMDSATPILTFIEDNNI